MGTHAGIPVEAAADGTGPLIDTAQANDGDTVAATPTQVGLKTLTHKAPLSGKFGTETLTTTNTDTEVLNLCISRTKGKNGHQSNK